MDVMNVDNLLRFFRKGGGDDEIIIKEQIHALTEELNKVKHNLKDLKSHDEAERKIKSAVKGIKDFVQNCAKIDLRGIDSVKKSKLLTKCLEFVVHQLAVTEKNPNDMDDNLQAVIMNLDGVARVFTAKEETEKETQGRFSPASWGSEKVRDMDGQEKGKAGKCSRCTDLKKQIESLQKENAELVTRQQKEKETSNSQSEESRKLREKIGDLKRKNAELEKKLQQESEAKEGALNRYSKLAGDKMKVGNPDIADLSDPNRPLKLCDEFGELYCNEWTDALEYLQNKATKGKSAFRGYQTIHVHGRSLEVEEKGSVEVLLEALKNCFDDSKEYVDHQRIAILNAVTGKTEGDIKTIMGGGSRTIAAAPGCSSGNLKERTFPMLEKDIRTDGYHTKLNEAIREFQRNLGTQTVKFMPKIISQKALRILRQVTKEDDPRKSENSDGDIMQIYVEKCTQLCWLMRIQFPPIHLKFDIKGDFDGKLYTPYLNSGEKVLFPVWPAMFLHEENGPLMRKGVVECVRKT